jgi:hypothetical protein
MVILTLSSIALLGCGGGIEQAYASDSDNPTVWIEIGGQLERIDNGQQFFSPPLVAGATALGFQSPLAVQSPPKYAYGIEGKITFEPQNADWVFSASVRYGRSNGHKALYQQKQANQFTLKFYPPLPTLYPFIPSTVPRTPPTPYHVNATGRNSASHTILDFQAGKDVGLGLFSGKNGSLLSLGIRFAQFSSHSQQHLSGVVAFHYPPTSAFKYPKYHHRYLADSNIAHSFSGIGPSISWSESVALAGNSESGQLAVDWGVNAAVLFGRQKATGTNRMTDKFYSKGVVSRTYVYGLSTAYSRREINRSRSVVVPNVGGFAGISFNYPNAKVSLGYRADFFFGAMDGGIETRKTYDRGFYGPFATISIGLGG